MSDTALTTMQLRSRLLKIDRVWTAIAIGLGIGFILAPAQAMASIEFALTALVGIAPYFALAIGIAAWTKATSVDSSIALVFKGNPVRMIFVAAVFGAVSPFCCCGVIPLIASLLAMGVPLAPVMAFWLASPIIDPQMFLLTVGALGTEFAVAKTLGAIFFGLFGGFATMAMQRAGRFADPLKPAVNRTECGNSSCGPKELKTEIVWRFWQYKERRAIFYKEFLSIMQFLGKWMTVAFLLESLMLAYVPAETVASILGSNNDFAIPLATFIGVPAY